MLIAIVASTPEGVIGQDQAMPWRLSSDLKRFKKLTMGGTLLMGRKTYDSIGRPLPGRQTWVLTRNPNWRIDGVRSMPSEAEVMAAAASQDIFVVGGGEIYRQWLPRCQEVWWTRVDAELSGDTRVDLNLEEFEVVQRESFPITDKDEYRTEWLRLVRK
ncbi:dihydrofolate reductase [Allorhodopirellula solitaria]|uniref:Dihydrofolate reductase n=1 Tax=Allorhodopirellula solitaria TaxID=2527987 RepID=A0A5C5XPQ2_9BACT|nr:dihydrofolate reductase [Allorhodopirellula solitaria]TWT65206.1 Dihydrofolate reductase type 3 [Allorhodopirellula solitaria]